MLDTRYFAHGRRKDLSRGGQMEFFLVGANSGKMKFYQLQNYEQNVFLLKTYDNISNFQIQGEGTPS